MIWEEIFGKRRDLDLDNYFPIYYGRMWETTQLDTLLGGHCDASWDLDGRRRGDGTILDLFRHKDRTTEADERPHSRY